MKVQNWFIIMTVLAFTSFISFLQIDSAYADEHNMNGTFMNVGVISGLLAALALFMAYQSQKK
jgi:hypothetical protein